MVGQVFETNYQDFHSFTVNTFQSHAILGIDVPGGFEKFTFGTVQCEYDDTPEAEFNRFRQQFEMFASPLGDRIRK